MGLQGDLVEASKLFTEAKDLPERLDQLDLSVELAPQKSAEERGKPVLRLTVVESLYHQGTADEPFNFVSKFERMLMIDEQPYVRQAKATEEWKKLDFAWLNEGYGTVVIRNEEGTFPNTKPTDEEKQEAEARVLEVGYENETPWLVYPRASMRVCPTKPLFIRSRSGKSRFTLCVIPS
jgi:hypothetical protein